MIDLILDQFRNTTQQYSDSRNRSNHPNMATLTDLQFHYENICINVIISDDKTNIDKIIYTYNLLDDCIHIKWSTINHMFENPKDSMLATISNYLNRMTEEDYSILSASSVMSISATDFSGNRENTDYLIRNFIRGFAVISVLSRLIHANKYIYIRILPSNHHIFTRNNLKVTRMGIIMHLKCIDVHDKFLKHGLDCINRWLFVFIRGDSVDKTEALLELISNYLCKPKDIPEAASIEKRLCRIEKLLSISTQSSAI